MPSAIPETLGADARVAVDRVHTLGPMAALVSHAVIIVDLAELPTVARDTLTPGTQAEWSYSSGLGQLSFSISPPLYGLKFLVDP